MTRKLVDVGRSSSQDSRSVEFFSMAERHAMEQSKGSAWLYEKELNKALCLEWHEDENLVKRGDYVKWADGAQWSEGYVVPIEFPYEISYRITSIDGFRRESGIPMIGALASFVPSNLHNITDIHGNPVTGYDPS